MATSFQPADALRQAAVKPPSLFFRCFLLFVVHFLSAGIGITLLTHPERVVAFWPPNGLLLGVFLVRPRTDRIPFAATAFFSYLLANVLLQRPWAVGVIFALINTAEAYLASWILLDRFAGRITLSSLREALWFICVTFGVPAIFALVGAFITKASFVEVSFWKTWHAWLASDVISILLVAPLVIAWLHRGRNTANLSGVRRKAEWGALLVCTLLAADVVFSDRIPALSGQPSSTYFLFPILMWAAMRFGLRGISTISLTLGLIAVWSAAYGVGLFEPYPSDAQRVLLVQEFLGVHMLSSLIITAILEERKRLQRAREKAYADLAKSHAELQATQLQLIQAEKLESVGRLAAGTAHEVRNPLAVVLMGVSYLKRHMSTDSSMHGDVIMRMEEAVQRADRVIRGLLDFSARRPLDRIELSIQDVIRSALELVRNELVRAHVTVLTDWQPELPFITGDRQKLEQVFVNVFLNAVQAMQGSGTLTVIVDNHTAAAEDRALLPHFHIGRRLVRVRIQDTGTGVPTELLEKIFDPFFTTKPIGQGVGLGLSIVRTIVSLHDGVIAIDNRPEGGAEVSVYFPVEESG